MLIGHECDERLCAAKAASGSGSDVNRASRGRGKKLNFEEKHDKRKWYRAKVRSPGP